MTRVFLRPTTADDLPKITGEALPYRIKAITVEVDGHVLGIGGIAFPPDGTVLAFVEQSDDAKKYPVSFHRAGLAAMAMIRASGVPRVIATADTSSEAAVRWLKRLGFVEAAAELQGVPGKRLFCWSREFDSGTKADRRSPARPRRS